MEISGWFVMALGMTTVFIGLIALQFMTKLMSLCCRLFVRNPKA
ncbi:MAG: OadG family protein [Eubacteriales bacterium]|nr:OadG family protein [Eubacteriales bacterium]